MADPQAALDRAFDEKNLVLVYQPIHDTVSGAIVAAEALLRQRRESGEIREAQIITSAAEEGSAPELFRLDSFVMRAACRDASRWIDVRLNVNLSPREFQEGNLLARLPPNAANVDLEITETSYIESPEETMHMLSALRERGIGLWLDDFGTGHSSLEHLQHFPLDGLKIAAQFMDISDKRCRAITKSIIALAHELGLRVIAEGVEHREQLEFLRGEGCDAVQGFLLSRPMELGQLLDSIDRGAAPDLPARSS
ncbi:MAG TPA: EAL domain-containing protein [Thermoanaerobaculia bacterium]|nr:EAL domain-containing protein [Thermoanaerobaculia bacterium]